MISNCGHDENGRYTGGKAGDQTGTEWQIIPWYNRPWNCVIRFKNQQVAQMIADISRAAAKNDLIGYDQNQRTTYWLHLKASNYDPAQITIACEADCSSGVAANVKATGYRLGIQALKNVSIDAYTGNLRAVLKAAGAIVLTASKYLTSDKYLLPGDIMLYEGHHTAINLDMGSNASWGTSDNPSTPSQKNYLSKGDKGTEVEEMQEKLIACGYSCGSYGADGDFGSGTDSAVRSFQKDYGLTVDGKFGPASKAKLDEVYAAKISSNYEKISISTTSPSVKGIRVCGNKVPVCSEPGNANKIVGYLNDGNLISCDYRAWTNGSCFYHYADGWVDGKNLQGWVADNGRWWYLIGNGTLSYPKKQLYKVGIDTYYFDEDGWMVTGWQQIDEKWYYFRSWGGMQYDAVFGVEKDGITDYYYADKNGVMASDEWLKINGEWYYFRDWGARLYNAFHDDGENLYYLKSDGKMAHDEWLQINGKWYYFRSWGAAYRNELFTDPSDGNVYFGDSDGSMVHDEWIQVEEDWYYFRSWGAAMNIGLWSDGVNTYYFGKDCKMKTGWIIADDDTYFFRDWGARLYDAWILDGETWKYVDKEGKYIPEKDTNEQPDGSDGSVIYAKNNTKVQ